MLNDKALQKIKIQQGRQTSILDKVSDLPNGWELVSFMDEIKDSNGNLYKNPFKTKSSLNCCLIRCRGDHDGSGDKIKYNYYIIRTRIAVESARLGNIIKEWTNKIEKNGDNLVLYLVKSNLLNEKQNPIGSTVIKQILYTWRDREKEKEERNSEVINEVEKILNYAEKNEASDIHFEAREDEMKIKIRINGLLSVYKEGLPYEVGVRYGGVIYNIFGETSTNQFEPNKILSSLVKHTINGVPFRARLASAPMNPNGFDMVLRLLKIEPPERPKQLSELGYLKNEANIIKKALAKAIGLVMIAGTTGSGKSTTLQHMLLNIIKEEGGVSKILTVEDPPEYLIPGASQIPVKDSGIGGADSAKKQFDDSIKAAMRLDPEIIMIGEVRDRNSAETLVKAVQSGHKVLSTVHAPSAPGIISRLYNLGIGKDVLASPDFISGLIYQKLLPIICPHCAVDFSGEIIPPKHPYEKIVHNMNLLPIEQINKFKKEMIDNKLTNIDFIRYLQDKRILSLSDVEEVKEEYNKLNDPEEALALLSRISSVCDIKGSNIKFKGQGCKNCNGTGIVGRTVVSEVLSPDLKMLDFINRGHDAELLVYWRKTMGGRFAIEDAYEKMKAGQIDPYDIERNLAPIGSKLV